jgi:hypothetical protein
MNERTLLSLPRCQDGERQGGGQILDLHNLHNPPLGVVDVEILDPLKLELLARRPGLQQTVERVQNLTAIPPIGRRSI